MYLNSHSARPTLDYSSQGILKNYNVASMHGIAVDLYLYLDLGNHKMLSVTIECQSLIL
jgi:hypothetical protein